jgi:hypothetical protein
MCAVAASGPVPCTTRALLAIALWCGGGLARAAEGSPQVESFAVQRASLRPLTSSEDGRYRVSARLKRTESGSDGDRALTLRSQVKSSSASCGPIEPLFIDSFE